MFNVRNSGTNLWTSHFLNILARCLHSIMNYTKSKHLVSTNSICLLPGLSSSYLHVTHDEISVCLAIWLIWWTNSFVIKMINTPGHVLFPGWPLCKRSGLTLIEVSQHAYSSYLAFSLPFIFYHVILATWCNWLDFYWCWIKLCLSLSLSLRLKGSKRWLKFVICSTYPKAKGIDLFYRGASSDK